MKYMEIKKYTKLHSNTFYFYTIFCKVENVRTHSSLCDDKHFMKVKQVSFELITCYSTCPILKLIKKNLLIKRNRNKSISKLNLTFLTNENKTNPTFLMKKPLMTCRLANTPRYLTKN